MSLPLKILNVKEIKIQLNIESKNVNLCTAYWRDSKEGRKTRNNWIFINQELYDKSFDYIGYNGKEEYWKTYVPKQKSNKKYFTRKSPEEIIPYKDRNIRRSPILMINSETNEEITSLSIMEVCRQYNLVNSKVQKCLDAEFGKYKHHGFYFKRL
jgi:hypothetical protein